MQRNKGNISRYANVQHLEGVGHFECKANEKNLGDFGVQKYDCEIGSFTSIDPLWEKYYSETPYHYCSNNPVMASDPSGLSEYYDTNVNDYRNPIIAEAMKVLGYVNRFNRGIARVEKELEENENKKPIFNYNKVGVFEVIVFASYQENDFANIETVEKMSEKASEKMSEKTSGKMSGKASGKTTVKIVEIIKTQKDITIPELSDQIGITERSIQRNLDKLKREGKIRRVGADRGGHWEVC